MRKGERFLVWVVCVLLFVAGVVFGSGFGLTKGVINSLSDVAQFLGSAATVVAAIFAYFAWNSWRDQFVHVESFKLVTDLCAVMPDVHHLQSLITLSIVWYGPEYEGLDEGKKARLLADIKELDNKWDTSKVRYFSSYYALQALLNDGELAEISLTPKYLDGLRDQLGMVNQFNLGRPANKLMLDMELKGLYASKLKSFQAALEVRSEIAKRIKN